MSPLIFSKMRYMKSACFLTMVQVFFLWVSNCNTSSRLAFVSAFTPGPLGLRASLPRHDGRRPRRKASDQGRSQGEGTLGPCPSRQPKAPFLPVTALSPPVAALFRGCGKRGAGCAVAHPGNLEGEQNTLFAHPDFMKTFCSTHLNLIQRHFRAPLF